MKKPIVVAKAPVNLSSIATKIRTEYGRVQAKAKEAVQHAINAGRLLVEAKAALKHGQWLPWLKANCPEISERTAEIYMQVAKRAPLLLESKSAAAADFTTMREILALTVEQKREVLERTIKRNAAPKVLAALESGAIDLRETERIVNLAPKHKQAATLRDILENKANRQAQRTAFGAQELATDIGTFLSESDQARTLKALLEVAAHVSWEEWIYLRDALDRMIEAALAQRVAVVEALHKVVEGYRANPLPDEPLSADELERACSEALLDAGPQRFIGMLNDYVALADASPSTTRPTLAPAR